MNDKKPITKYPEADTRQRILVLMAVYNGVPWLADQVSSILKQRDVIIDLIINVDRSSDGSESWCESIAETNTQISLMPTGQHFGSASANFFYLIKHADLALYDFVAFSDQDDIWNSDKLAHAARLMKQQGYSGYSGNVVAFKKDGPSNFIDKAQPQRAWDFLFEAGGPGCTYVLSRSLAEQIQRCIRENESLLNRFHYHDWFFYAFARSRGYRWLIDARSHMYYRQHGHNSIGINRGIKPFLRRVRNAVSGKAWQQTETLIQVLYHNASEAPPFHLPKSRWGFIKLSLFAGKCRRRRRDQFYFFFLCLLMGLRGRAEAGVRHSSGRPGD